MMKEKGYKYLFGPIPSRRLGRSLGVNLVPHKICSYDCLYCEVGATTATTTERKNYIVPDKIIDEIKDFINSGVKIDVITLTGAGEPTLNSSIGKLIGFIKKLTNIPVAVLTNGSLLWSNRVKKALLEADIVIPSVDSVDEKDFYKVDRPDKQIELKTILSGIKEFSYTYHGRLWLEVLIVKGINDSDFSICNLGRWASTLKAQKLQLGTIIRPPASEANPVSYERLEEIAAILKDYLNYPVEIIGDFEGKSEHKRVSAELLVKSCKMRPLTKENIIEIYGKSDNLDRIVTELIKEGKLKKKNFGNKRFYTG